MSQERLRIEEVIKMTTTNGSLDMSPSEMLGGTARHHQDSLEFLTPSGLEKLRQKKHINQLVYGYGSNTSKRLSGTKVEKNILSSPQRFNRFGSKS